MQLISAVKLDNEPGFLSSLRQIYTFMEAQRRAPFLTLEMVFAGAGTGSRRLSITALNIREAESYTAERIEALAQGLDRLSTFLADCEDDTIIFAQTTKEAVMANMAYAVEQIGRYLRILQLADVGLLVGIPAVAGMDLEEAIIAAADNTDVKTLDGQDERVLSFQDILTRQHHKIISTATAQLVSVDDDEL